MKRDDNGLPEIIVPLGKALKDARLAAELSIDEVAEQLNLGPSTVSELEDNLENILVIKKYPIIYLRGYLTNYAKLVNLTTLALFVEYQQLKVGAPQKVLPTSNMIIPVAKKRSKLFPLLLFVIVVLVAIFCFFQQQLFSTFYQSLPTEKTSLAKTTITKKAITNSAHKLSLITRLNNHSEAQPSSVENSLESQQLSVTEQGLIVTFKAACWTEIADATGKRIAFGLYQNGRILTLSGVAPFHLKLGDPSVVEIQYQDQIIEGDFTPGRSAQFSVPLS